MSETPETHRLQNFWDHRYHQFSLQESGIISLSRESNDLMYRCKELAYRRALHKARITPDRPHRLLDCGCGQGFFAFLAKRIFAQYTYTGIDISAKAIAYLQERFPEHTWICSDIGDPAFEATGAYDLVQALDMLHLIIDDAHHRRAVRNLAASLAPGGVGLLTDVLPRRRLSVGSYLVYRTLPHYEELFRMTGLRRLATIPIYYWFPDLTQPGHPLWRFSSFLPTRLIYGIDRLLLWSRLPRMLPGHDARMKLMIVRRVS